MGNPLLDPPVGHTSGTPIVGHTWRDLLCGSSPWLTTSWGNTLGDPVWTPLWALSGGKTGRPSWEPLWESAGDPLGEPPLMGSSGELPF